LSSGYGPTYQVDDSGSTVWEKDFKSLLDRITSFGEYKGGDLAVGTCDGGFLLMNSDLNGRKAPLLWRIDKNGNEVHYYFR